MQAPRRSHVKFVADLHRDLAERIPVRQVQAEDIHCHWPSSHAGQPEPAAACAAWASSRSSLAGARTHQSARDEPGGRKLLTHSGHEAAVGSPRASGSVVPQVNANELPSRMTATGTGPRPERYLDAPVAAHTAPLSWLV